MFITFLQRCFPFCNEGKKYKSKLILPKTYINRNKKINYVGSWVSSLGNRLIERIKMEIIVYKKSNSHIVFIFKKLQINLWTHRHTYRSDSLFVLLGVLPGLKILRIHLDFKFNFSALEINFSYFAWSLLQMNRTFRTLEYESMKVWKYEYISLDVF